MVTQQRINLRKRNDVWGLYDPMRLQDVSATAFTAKLTFNHIRISLVVEKQTRQGGCRRVWIGYGKKYWISAVLSCINSMG